MDAFNSLSALPPGQRWHGQTAPVPVAVALIRQAADVGEELLLIRRAGGPYTGQWALVGGKWDFGETLAEAIVREVREETGLTTAFVALRALVSERVAPWTADAPAAHFLLLVCDLVVRDGRATEQQEGFVDWFGAADIEALYAEGRIIPSDYAMIREFSAATRSSAYVEVEMRALLDGTAAQPSQMLRFTRVDRERNADDEVARIS
ncbi:MAG: NUDIX hydrolase [Anaerolineae bacterium]|uniref:NUDIX hydrolase n=1 Tax=Promineifilum sp. TaxID=2664178 RepID=UPI001DD2929A|nr:NUDIX hydrolase [Anaerolineales bacterium]MCB8934417.1 NUDIX hydrolase [Promineifilum sp.]MCO5181737.1 NUDIX hydrolase [Promineifilum sp.]MCW5847379.1 NUDIX hydrolase [Anaerolineae bacterium]